MPLPAVLTPTVNMKISSAISIKREFKRLNTVTLVLLFFQLQVPLPLCLACPVSGKLQGDELTLVFHFRNRLSCVLEVVVPPPVIPLRVIFQLLLT